MARPPPSSGGGPPVSFKTVPGRHRTQKWNTARTYDYSGGDWGGYDPYDDYGAEYDDKQAPPPMPSQQQGYNPPPPVAGHGNYPRPARQSSFDEGDERRTFSGPGAFPPASGRVPSGSPTRRSGDYPRPSTAGRPATGNRDFTNPEQVPPPLNPSMRGSPAPGLIGPGMVPPPRKSSVTADAAPVGLTGPPLPPPEEKKDEKELPTIPFIRPSDIYKRMQAEKERERKSSMESSGRPNLADLDGTSATRSSSGQRPLSSVQEGEGEASVQTTPTAVAGGYGTDPAANILAERSHDVHVNDVGKPGTLPHLDRNNPAASILAERTHDVPVSDVGQPGTLSHQPSAGYRSMVNQAFDTSSASRTHTMASETADVSRSNTTSTSNTSGISPIIPRPAPYEQPVSTIAEEPARRSGESVRVTPGYRRSLDPPSHDNSPARTPGLDDANRGRSLSGGFAAENVSATGKGQDYSTREADLAREVDSSPTKAGTFEPQVAQRQSDVQNEFLEHHTPPTTDGFEAPRSASPSKSRVRQLADQYQERDDASRRNSVGSTGALSHKSSWSNFRGSDENLAATHAAASANSNIPQRHATDASNMVSESDYGGVEEGGIRDSPVIDAERPGFGREASFRPQLPGQWVSTTNILAAPTGEGTSAPSSTSKGLDESQLSAEKDRTPRASREQEPIDLTPTTTKHPLAASQPSDNNSPSMLAQAQTAGSALGAALLASVGQGHQTRDFGSSSSPAKEVEIPSSRNATGEMGYLQRPELGRGDTEASTASTVTAASSDDLYSVSNAPTPLPKDAERSAGEIPSAGSEASSFFAPATVAPLRMSSPPRTSSGQAPAPTYDRDNGGLERDDSILRREIERSLDFESDNVARTQDALDGPDNLRRVEGGQSALPAYEIKEDKPLPHMPMMLDQRFSWEIPDKQSGLLGTPEKETPTTPGVGASANASSSSPLPKPTHTIPRVQEPEQPEILPEMPYERPRSRGLHIMNADNSDSEDERDDATARPAQLRDSMAAERGLETGLPIGAIGAGAAVAAVAAVGAGAVALASNDRLGSGDGLSTEGSGIISPMTKSQENLHMGSLGDVSVPSPPAVEDGLQVREPHPLVDNDYDARAPEVFDSTSSVSRDTNTPYFPPPPPPEKEASLQDQQQTSPTTPTTPSAKSGKIPPFREILSLKTPAARIQTYDSTRETFASMNTGLSDWLAAMIEQNPEYSTLASNPPPSLATSATWKAGHKASPSLAKLGSKLPFGGDSSGGTPQRSGTVTGATSSGAAGDGEGMAQLQQKGKDLMKGAGVLGGKAQAGAKGLLAKGRSRFGTQRESKGGGLGGAKQAPPTPPSLQPLSTSSTTPSTNTTNTTLSRSIDPTPAIMDQPDPVTQSQSQPQPEPPSQEAEHPAPSLIVAAASQSPLPAPVPLAAPKQPEISIPTAQSQQPTHPPPRSGTQTPLSVSNDPGPPSRPPSRPLSRTFSRLGRRLSRSLSRHSRSLSRPASLILDKTITGSSLSSGRARHGATETGVISENDNRGAGTGLGTLEFDADDPGYYPISTTGAMDAGSASAVGGAESSGVVSPWSEPESLDFTELEALRSVTPVRLGVLPSPTGESFIGSWKEGRPGTAVTGDEVDSGVMAGGESVGSPKTPTQRMFMTGRESGEGKVEDEDEDDELYNRTPVAARIHLADEPKEDSKELVATTSWSGGEGQSHEDDMDRNATTAAADSDLEKQQQHDMAFQVDLLEKTKAAASGPTVNPSHEEHSGEDVHDTTPVFVTRDSGVVGLDQGEDEKETGSELFLAQRPKSLEDSTDLSQAVDMDTSQDYTILSSPPVLDKALPRFPSNISNTSGNGLVGTAQESAADATTADTRSVVSSNDNFHDAIAEPTGKDENESRRSSVSSLNNGDDAEPTTAIQLHPPQQLGPQTLLDQSSGFDGGSLAPQRPALERPHSYVELGTDASGAPLQESLDIKQASSSNFNLREAPKSPANDRGKKRFSFARDGAEIDATPKRSVAVTKNRRPTLTSPTSIMAASHISDHFGLEDLQHSMETGRADSVYREPEIYGKQEKRRSSVWRALKRGTSKSKADGKRTPNDQQHASPAVGMNQQRQVASSSSETPTKPQRASTSAVDPDAKKKRFSGLGSLFSRSSTTTGRKLEKKEKQRHSQVIDAASQTREPATAGDYDVYEARRRQDFPNLQARLPEVYPPMPSVQPPRAAQPEGVYSDDVDDWKDPPSGGWYAPKHQSNSQPPHQVSQPPQRYRQLHSNRRRTSAPSDWIESSYVDAGYGGSAYSAGPYPTDARPDLHQVSTGAFAHPTDEIRNQPPPMYSQQATNAPYNRRHSSYVSDGSQLSPQISGQSEWERLQLQQQRSSSSSVSPVQPRSASDGLPPPGRFRVGSISEEMTREIPGLAMTNADRQQTPWAITLPPDPVRQKRESVPANSQYESTPGDNYTWPMGGMDESTPARPMLYQPPPGTLYADAERYGNEDFARDNPYPVTGYSRGPSSRPLPPPITTQFNQSGRYYPSQYERQRSGGYPERRDNPTDNEDEVVMRGTSYPGQEWLPYSAQA